MLTQTNGNSFSPRTWSELTSTDLSLGLFVSSTGCFCCGCGSKAINYGCALRGKVTVGLILYTVIVCRQWLLRFIFIVRQVVEIPEGFLALVRGFADTFSIIFFRIKAAEEVLTRLSPQPTWRKTHQWKQRQKVSVFYWTICFAFCNSVCQWASWTTISNEGNAPPSTISTNVTEIDCINPFTVNWRLVCDTT